jgi:hypothetical protein
VPQGKIQIGTIQQPPGRRDFVALAVDTEIGDNNFSGDLFGRVTVEPLF